MLGQDFLYTRFILPKSEHVGSQMVPVSESGLFLAYKSLLPSNRRFK